MGAIGALGVGAFVAVAAACGVRFPEGYACASSDQCEDGLSCLYPLGSGCAAQGECSVPTTDCSGTTAGLILCSCGTEPLDLSCLPANAELLQPTATGAACAGDGGLADGAGEGGDAISESD
jgi:hypothetical protein